MARGVTVLVTSSLLCGAAGAEEPSSASSVAPPIAIHRVLHPFRPGVVVGLRFLYALPFGSFGSDAAGATTAMRDLTGDLSAGQMDIGYQVGRELFLGGQFTLGLGGAGDPASRECRARGLSCSVRDIDVGLVAEYRFPSDRPLSPFIGVGASAETLELVRHKEGFKSDVHATGFCGSLEAGVDFHLGGGFAIGPFVHYRLGTFLSTTVQSFYAAQEVPGIVTVATDSGISGGLHHWLAFGLRGRWYGSNP